MLTLIVRNVCGLTSHLATTRLTGHGVTLCGTCHTKAGVEVRASVQHGGRKGTHLPTSLQSPPKCCSHMFPSRRLGKVQDRESVWLKEDFWL